MSALVKGSSSVSTHAEQLVETCYRYTGAHRNAHSGARADSSRLEKSAAQRSILLIPPKPAWLRSGTGGASSFNDRREDARGGLPFDVRTLAVLDPDNPTQARGSRGARERRHLRVTTSPGCQAVGLSTWFLHMQRCPRCRRRAVSASLSPRMNSELGRANYSCDKRRSDAALY